jgi:hypothetical protein
VTENGEVVRPVIEAVSGLILVHDHIEHPLQSVLDAPMRADDLAKRSAVIAVLRR